MSEVDLMALTATEASQRTDAIRPAREAGTRPALSLVYGTANRS